MPGETDAKLQEFKNSLNLKAEELVLQGFADRIVELNRLLLTPMFNACNFAESVEDFNIPEMETVEAANHQDKDNAGNPDNADNADNADNLGQSDNANILEKVEPSEGEMNTNSTEEASVTVPCNSTVCDMIEIVKPIIKKLIEDSHVLELWITLMIPKIEDGNNFGVSVQEETLAKIKFVEGQAAIFFDKIAYYFKKRGKLITVIFKRRHVQDYRAAVADLDGRKILSLLLVLRKIRDHYCTMREMIIKNMELIKSPRSSHIDSLY